MSRKKKHPDVLRECREMVIERAAEITQALIGKAIEGSHQHAKFLFDFAFEAAPKKDEEEALPGPSLAEILLQRLDELEAEDEEATCDA